MQMSPVKYNLFQLEGGLDLVTPTMSLRPGVARDSINFEVSITGGYTRIGGYERFDGRANPSDATYSAITLDAIAGVNVGDTITNAAATASAYVIAIDTGGKYIYYTRPVGSFAVSDVIKVGAATIGNVTALGGGTITPALSATYLALAADAYRTLIGAVPGSGPVRGVTYYKGTVYAWRNNAGGTALAMYKSSSTGWQAVSFGYELSFNTGTATINDGDTVVGGTSGATGVVARVVLESGAWSGTAAGRLILSSTTGTFQAGELLKVSGASKATCGGAASAITFLPGGRVEVVKGNFGGQSQNTKLYGCDGKNRGWEFDGTTMVPIRTGMATDTPSHVAVHKNYLFFSFGPSLQNSGIGTPYIWSPVYGANEAVMPEDITNIIQLPGNQSTGALAVYTDSNTFILYGSSTSDFKLTPFNTGFGAKAYTAQNMEQSYALDNRGVVGLNTTLNYGNFDPNVLTLNVRPFTQVRRNSSTASGLNREKSQYRVFYSDGYGLYITLVNGKSYGAMPVYFPNPVNCWCEGATPNGVETSFFGSTNGFVYRMDAGTSFDGSNIDYRFVTTFNAIGSPRLLKRFRKAALEVTGNTYAEFQFGWTLSYADATLKDQPQASSYASSLTQAYWDSGITWDSFVFDGRNLAPSEVELCGSGENIAVTVSGSSNAYQSFTINTIVLHYSFRRGLR